METLKAGKIRFNDQFQLTNAATGVKIPLNFGRGGQAEAYKQHAATVGPLSGSSDTHAITLDSHYTTIGTENSVMLTTLYNDGTTRHDIIDVEVDEKRK